MILGVLRWDDSGRVLSGRHPRPCVLGSCRHCDGRAYASQCVIGERQLPSVPRMSASGSSMGLLPMMCREDVDVAVKGHRGGSLLPDCLFCRLSSCKVQPLESSPVSFWVAFPCL